MGGNLMRTVTFADAGLVKKLNSTLLPVWHNQDPEAMGEIFEEEPVDQPIPTGANAYPCGGGGGNIRAYFCTPEGEIFHYVEGYWPAENFAQEVDVALKFYAAHKNDDKNTRDAAAKVALNAAITAIEKDRADLAAKNAQEFQKPITESAVQRTHAAMGLRVNAYNSGITQVGQQINDVMLAIVRNNLGRGIIK